MGGSKVTLRLSNPLTDTLSKTDTTLPYQIAHFSKLNWVAVKEASIVQLHRLFVHWWPAAMWND